MARPKGKKVDPARHKAQPWRLHTLAPDFEIHDVWVLPIVADPSKGETFQRFFDVVKKNGLESGSKASQLLVWLRAALGDVFGWEYKDKDIRVPGTNERSITERFTEEDRRTNRVSGDGTPTIPNSITRLSLVYERENDALFEIHNKTVSGLFHLSFVDTEDGYKVPELAVYAKMRDFKSKLYMALIDPFRIIAVYPQWIARIARKWDEELTKFRVMSGTSAPASSSPARPATR